MTGQIYPLRPHHALCLGFFRGMGYSGEFVSNMTAKKELLSRGATVRLTDRADCICADCPNRLPDGGCTSGEKVGRYDRAVLELCGLTFGQELSYRALCALASRCILEPQARETVCSDCQWTELCR